jgi:hypothetical protein
MELKRASKTLPFPLKERKRGKIAKVWMIRE